MAAPPEVTIKNLSGKFVMNKSLSDDTNNLLALQGISWLTRKAISLATVVLTIKQYSDDKGAIHIDITSVASGLSTTQEDRTLDWIDRPHKDKIFGNVIGRSRNINLSTGTFEPVASYSDAELQFLQAKFLRDGKTASQFDDNTTLVQSYVKNQDSGYGWTAEQLWGFEQINGKRYHTRRVIVKNAKGDKSELVRLVYNYQGTTDGRYNEELVVDDGLMVDDGLVVDDGLLYGEGDADGDAGDLDDDSDMEGLAWEDAADLDDDTDMEGLAWEDATTTNAENETERNIGLTDTKDDSKSNTDRSIVGLADTGKEISSTREAADLGIITNETGGEIESDDGDNGTITDDYEADSEELVVAFDRRRYSEVVGGMSEISMTDTIICVGFGYALMYATYKERHSLHDMPKIA